MTNSDTINFNCQHSNCSGVMANLDSVNLNCANVNYKFDHRVDTSKLYQTLNLPKRFESPYLFCGYGTQKERQNPFYKTTTSDYGWYTPSPHTVPHRYFPRSTRFTNHMAKCGMYRNYSLNTMMDKSFI